MWDIYDFLMQRNPELNIQNNVDIPKYLLRCRNVYIYQEGLTALIECCRWGQHYFAADLVNRGADIEVEAKVRPIPVVLMQSFNLASRV